MGRKESRFEKPRRIYLFFRNSICSNHQCRKIVLQVFLSSTQIGAVSIDSNLQAKAIDASRMRLDGVKPIPMNVFFLRAYTDVLRT